MSVSGNTLGSSISMFPCFYLPFYLNMFEENAVRPNKENDRIYVLDQPIK